MKTCPRCHAEKSLGEFYRRSDSKDGRMRLCKVCYDDGRKAYVESDQGHAAAVRATAAWRQRNPNYTYRPGVLQNRARSAINQALRRGTLSKPQSCELCGKVGSVHGHHLNGYDRVNYYDLQWLCARCHGLRHRKVI